MAGEAVPSVSTIDANGVQSEATGPWSEEMYRISRAGTDSLVQHEGHLARLNAICEQSLTDGRNGASWINQKFGILATEPNAESAGAENTMKAGNVAEMTAAAVQNVIGTANANIASAMADLKNILAFNLGDLKASLNPALQAIASSLAVVQANLAAGAPKSGAVENPVVVVNPVKA